MADQDISSEVKRFGDCCLYARAIYIHYKILFEHTESYEQNDKRRNLLAKIAPTFFGDLNYMMISSIILELCKLTEPKSTVELTTHYLVKNSDFKGENLSKIQSIISKLDRFHNKIKLARNNIIAHYNRVAVMEDIALGSADNTEWNNFWLNLQDFLNIFYARYCNDPHFKLNGVGLMSDADSLINALKESTYFQTLLEDNKTTEICFETTKASEYENA